MALLLPKSLFLHVPRTGGSTVRKVVQDLGLAVAEVRCDHHVLTKQSIKSACCMHNTLSEIGYEYLDLQDRFTFAFVRHPLTWYQSYWSLRTYHNSWEWDNRIDMKLKADTFTQFLQNVLEHFPGRASFMFERFFKDSVPLDFIGRYERLEEDLAYALSTAGEPVDPITFALPRAWNSGVKRYGMAQRCLYTEELHAAICEQETGIMDRFGYKPEDVPFYDEPYIQEARHCAALHSFAA